MSRNIMHLLTRRTNSSHAHLRDGLPFRSRPVQITPPAALKMRMLLAMWQVDSHTRLWTLPLKPRRRVVHTFIGAPNGKCSEAAHITSESTSLSVLLLFFAETVTLLVVETNTSRYYHQFLDNSDDGPSPQWDVTDAEMFAFLQVCLGTYLLHYAIRNLWNF